jgi:hypothetical protein
MSPGPSLARAPKARKRETIPDLIREEVLSFGLLISEMFKSVFVSRARLKLAVGRLLTSQLPPRPRPPGNPGYATVSKAIALREELRRLDPQQPYKAIWREVYRRVIPQYNALSELERREAKDQLRRRVYWRLRARRRRQRQRQLKQISSVL